MTNILPELSIYATPTSLAQICEDQKEPLADLISFASGHYGAKMMRFGDGLAETMNARLRRSAYSPYVSEIEQTANIISLTGVKTLQHSFTVGCSTIARDEDHNDGRSPAMMGTIDWEQVGNNLSSVVSLAVLDNPIFPEHPALSVQIGPAAFGLFMMNSEVAIKINRAPIPNTRNKKTDLSTVSDDEFRRIKGRNNLVYSLRSVANQSFFGRPPCAYLLRHAINLNMDFDQTLDFVTKTKTCDFGIMTVIGKNAGEAVTIEKHGAQSHTYSAYEPSANHWHEDSPFSARPNIPRTLNSVSRACAIADDKRSSIFSNQAFDFANDGVIDHSTRIMARVNPANGEVSLVTMHGNQPTSAAVSANFDGKKLCDVQHYELEASNPA